MTREEAIGWLQRWQSTLRGDGSPLELAILKAIEALKQPERKKGKWIMGNGMGTICSNCYYKLETTGLLSYCPHCGAKMEGEE